MEKFASYGFNKSHAAAYGYIAYVTAFLKANYPKEWMAALMTCDRDDITKVAKFIGEGLSMGIQILPPDVNEAGDSFLATESGIRFAMSGIKGVGQGVVEAIIAEREANGPFTTFYDFFTRIDTKRVGKKVIELMVLAGAFDFTGWTRDQMVASVEPMFDAAAREQKEQAKGMLSLFSLLDNEDEGQFKAPPQNVPKSEPTAALLKEKELLGFFLTGHPLDRFKSTLQRLSCVPLNRLKSLDSDSVVRAAFVIDSVGVRISQRSQKKFAILTISDGLERFELPIWPDLYDQCADLLQENRLGYAVLQIENRDGEFRLSCRWLNDLCQVNEAVIQDCDQAYDRAKLQVQRNSMMKARGDAPRKEKKAVNEKKTVQKPKVLGVTMDFSEGGLSQILEIKQILEANVGETKVCLGFKVGAQVNPVLHVDAALAANPTPECLQKLGALQGVSAELQDA
jgi:DNA polymerase-3 subunit alpha